MTNQTRISSLILLMSNKSPIIQTIILLPIRNPSIIIMLPVKIIEDASDHKMKIILFGVSPQKTPRMECFSHRVALSLNKYLRRSKKASRAIVRRLITHYRLWYHNMK